MEAICRRYAGSGAETIERIETMGKEAEIPGVGEVDGGKKGDAKKKKNLADDCLLCLQEVKITQKKLSKENCCMSEENLESFHATSDVKPGYSGTSVYASVPAWRPKGVRVDLFGERAEGADGDGKGDGELGVRKGDCGKGESHETATGPAGGFGSHTLNELAALTHGLDNEGRFCMVELPHNIALINVYVPNAGLGRSSGSNVGDGKLPVGGEPLPRIEYKLAFYWRLLETARHLVEKMGRHVVIVGDFNSCFDARDVHPLIGIENAFLPCELEALRAFTRHGFVDVYRELHPDETTYTCFDQKTNARQYNRGVRIDFCLVSAGLAGRVRRCEVVGADVVPARWSDHLALFVEIDVEDIEDTEGMNERESVREWSSLKRRLTNAGQRTLKEMFGGLRKKPKVEGA